MKYCYECGTELTDRLLKNEGMIPYCKKCGCFRFPVFSTAVSMITLNPERNRILLIRQYGKPGNILVAGYVNLGESAEAAVAREVSEEIGVKVTWLKFNKSEYFPRSNTLMLNFVCAVDSEALENVSREEIDHAEWFSPEEAEKNIRPDSLAERFLKAYLYGSDYGMHAGYQIP